MVIVCTSGTTVSEVVVIVWTSSLPSTVDRTVCRSLVTATVARIDWVSEPPGPTTYRLSTSDTSGTVALSTTEKLSLVDHSRT